MAQVTLTQSVKAAYTSVTTFAAPSITMSGSQPALCVVQHTLNASRTLNTPTDDKGNTWTLVGMKEKSAANWEQVKIWQCLAPASGATIVTGTSNFSSSGWISVYEISTPATDPFPTSKVGSNEFTGTSGNGSSSSLAAPDESLGLAWFVASAAPNSWVNGASHSELETWDNVNDDAYAEVRTISTADPAYVAPIGPNGISRDIVSLVVVAVPTSGRYFTLVRP